METRQYFLKPMNFFLALFAAILLVTGGAFVVSYVKERDLNTTKADRALARLV